jgi:hypothetical protein
MRTLQAYLPGNHPATPCTTINLEPLTLAPTGDTNGTLYFIVTFIAHYLARYLSPPPKVDDHTGKPSMGGRIGIDRYLQIRPVHLPKIGNVSSLANEPASRVGCACKVLTVLPTGHVGRVAQARGLDFLCVTVTVEHLLPMRSNNRVCSSAAEVWRA